MSETRPWPVQGAAAADGPQPGPGGAVEALEEEGAVDVPMEDERETPTLQQPEEERGAQLRQAAARTQLSTER